MLFSKVFKSNPIQTLELTINSGIGDNAIAFGPASVINGNIKLFLDKPITTKAIRITFKCEEWSQKKDYSTLFSIETNVLKQQVEVLGAGSHIYLFAVQLPSTVNYPPTIKEGYVGHRIEYSLQAHVDLIDNTTKSTQIIPITYLPLITFNETMSRQYMKKTLQINKGNESLHITANLVNPASCPGDLCSVKLFTHNNSSFSINQVHILLLSTTTTLHNRYSPDIPNAFGPTYQHKQHPLLTEMFYVSIPKHTTSITSICPFKIPAHCLPTTQNYFGKYIDISYEVFIMIPNLNDGSPPVDLSSANFLSQLLLNPQVIRLPLAITTVPYSHSLPILQIPFASEASDLPTFIVNNEESPLSSPVHSDWGSGSPIEEEHHHLEESFTFTEDLSGHLMVPPIMTRRSLSIHSNASG